MTASDEQYVPSDEDMRWHYAVKRMDDGATRTHAEQEYTRWLTAHDARVRRDAAREALDGLIADKAHMAALLRAENGGNVEDVLTHYRDTHYNITEKENA